MAARFGRCVNFGACGKADAKENIPFPAGVTDATCPECGKPLTPAAAKSGGPPIALIVLAIIVALAAAFGVTRFFSRGGTTTAAAPTTESTAAPAAATAAAAPAPAAAAVALALCGSNTIGSELGPDLVRGFLSSLGAASPSARSSGKDEQTVSGDVDGKPTDVTIAAHGSATAFAGLRSGDCQVGMASRRIESGEAAMLHPLGDMLSPSSEHVIGLDGIAVVVNASNPVSSLTVAQVKDLFSGRVRDWRAVGGNAGNVAIYARDDKSGTYDTFRTLVLDTAPLAAGARRFEDSTALSSAVAADEHAIGFIGLPYVGQTKALHIASGGPAILPTALTVGRETYPLTRRLFLYTASSPKNPLVARFVAYVQSDAGQQIVNRDGFVGTVTSLAVTRSSSRSLPAAAPARYRKLVDGYDQASFNFYFNTGSDVLDNKALVDVGRLVGILSTNAARNKSVVLAGFADSTGDPQANLVLSENRANAAAKELEAEGIRVADTVGFGQELPIRDNSTEAGREKNRRVEIFISR
jgi:phosphate transport system substrate-binding protein